jgi:hypothetical protein
VSIELSAPSRENRLNASGSMDPFDVAATHDIDISKARANSKWGHRIDPHVDREREWIETDLLYAGTATSYALVDRPHAPKTTANATGDVITTDGQLSVLELGATKPNIINPPTPVLQTRPNVIQSMIPVVVRFPITSFLQKRRAKFLC